MGWGTDFKANIFLNRLVFSSKDEVEDKIEEIKSNIESEKRVIISYAHSKEVREEGEIIDTDQLTYRINEKIDDITQHAKLLQLLELYLEHYDEQIPDKN